MDLIVELNGKTHQVTLPERIVDGQPFPVRMASATPSLMTAVLLRQAGVLVLRDGSGVDRHLHIRRAAVSRFSGEADLHLRGEVHSANQVSYPRATVRLDLPGQDQRRQNAASREQVIRSQITGKVLKVLVKTGDKLAPNQALLVIEAMKMENRVFSQAAGTVTSLSVKEGDAVQTGKELLRIAP